MSGDPRRARSSGSGGRDGGDASGPRVLYEAEIRTLADLTPDAIDAVADAFERLAAGSVRQPPVLSLELPEVRGELDVKTAWVDGWEVFCVKLSTGFFGNPAVGLPSASGLMAVLDARTGRPRALLLDGGYLTDLRTAAAGAVAARELARPDASRAAILGAGAQARWQLRALAAVRDLSEVRVWARGRVAADQLAAEMGAELRLPVRASSCVKEAVDGADVVVTTTPAREPLLSAELVRAGTHVTAMGSDGPGKRELDPALVAGADRVIVDDPDQSRTLGELQGFPTGTGPAPVALGDVLAGRAPGRVSQHDVTVCDLTGTGVQDSAIARWLLTATHVR